MGVREVGHGVDRRIAQRPQTGGGQAKDKEENDKAIARAEVDDPRNHSHSQRLEDKTPTVWHTVQGSLRALRPGSG
ncbi:MAG: hypothetical protein AB7P69_04975 [Candidatus Binatia bacterium]